MVRPTDELQCQGWQENKTQKLKKHLKSREMIPSRKILKEKLDERAKLPHLAFHDNHLEEYS